MVEGECCALSYNEDDEWFDDEDEEFSFEDSQGWFEKALADGFAERDEMLYGYINCYESTEDNIDETMKTNF